MLASCLKSTIVSALFLFPSTSPVGPLSMYIALTVRLWQPQRHRATIPNFWSDQRKR